MNATGILGVGVILAIAALLLTQVNVWRLHRRVIKLERDLKTWNAAAGRVAKTMAEGGPWKKPK